MNKCKSKFNGNVYDYYIIKKAAFPTAGSKSSDLYVININKNNFHTDIRTLMKEEGEVRFLTVYDFKSEFYDLDIFLKEREEKINNILNDRKL